MSNKIDKNNMKSKYQLVRGGKGLLLSSINDSVVRAAPKILCINFLHKMRSTECTATTIELEENLAKKLNLEFAKCRENHILGNAVGI